MKLKMEYKKTALFCFFIFLFGDAITQTIDKKIEATIHSPSLFRKNAGQWDANILYRSSSEGWNASVNFLNNGPSFCFSREGASPKNEKHPVSYSQLEHLVWNIAFANVSDKCVVTAKSKHDSRVNYFLGNKFSNYVVNVPEFESITYENAYENIDVVYYNKEGKLKYDVVVKPYGKVEQLKFVCEGISKLSFNNSSRLQIHTPWGILVEDLPESYQVINGKKINVEVKYKILDNNSYGFEIISAYNKNYELIIDPVVLDWSTYVGGTAATGNGYLRDIAADAQGNIYATGYYDSFMATTPGVYSATNNGQSDVFVFKLNSAGNALAYCTYIGGSGIDDGWGIDVNTNGEAVIAGTTGSSNFPVTTGAYDDTYNSAPGQSDAFVCLLNANGTALLYSSFIGGQYIDWARAVVFMPGGTSAAFCGITMSSNFPISSGAFDNTGGVMGGGQAGVTDGFVTHIKLDNTGVAPDAADLLYSSFIGGASNTKYEYATDIDVNVAGEVYLTGYTNSSDFTVTTGAYSTVYTAGNDAYVYKMKLDNTGVAPDITDLLYGTFIGGTGSETGMALVVSPLGDTVFVAGNTNSPNFPTTTGAYQTAISTGPLNDDLFVLKLYTGGSGLSDLRYSTYIGGSDGEGGVIMGIDAGTDASVFVTAMNYNGGSPTTACTFDPSFNGPPADPAGGDVLLYRVNSHGGLDYGTYIGGAEYDYFAKVVLTGDACMQECVVGLTAHSNQTTFPVTAGSYQTTKGSGANLDSPVIMKFKPNVNPGFTFSASPQCGVAVTFTDTTSSCGLWKTISSWQWDFGDGTISSLQNPTHIFNSGGTYNVKLKVGCPQDSIVIPVTVAGLQVATSGDTSVCTGASAQLSASVATSYTWIPATGLSATNIANPIATPSVTTTYSVIAMGGACSDTAVVTVSVDSMPVATISPDTSVCPGVSLTLTAGGGASYSWSTGAGLASILVSPTSSSLYTATVANGNCFVTAQCNVTLFAIPIADAGNDATVDKGSSTTLVATGGGTYLWLPSAGLSCITCANPLATPQTTTKYYVIVTNENGCTSLDSVLITVNDNCTDGNIYVPNAFSPNGDGQNDLLLVYGNCFTNFILKIYNRWGELVFETDDITEEWNGVFKGQELNSDVFAYVLNANFKNGTEIIKQGNITLVR